MISTGYIDKPDSYLVDSFENSLKSLATNSSPIGSSMVKFKVNMLKHCYVYHNVPGSSMIWMLALSDWSHFTQSLMECVIVLVNKVVWTSLK